MNLFSVKDRTVVVTGGGGNLGGQFTRALAEAGANVAVLDVDVSKVTASKQVLPIRTDLTQRSDVEAALAQIQSRYGVPHGLVNNAAIDFPPKPNDPTSKDFENFSGTKWDQVFGVNVRGALHASQVFGASMASQKRGSIVNIGSIYGIVAPDQRIYEQSDGATFIKPAAYGASKAALWSLTRYLATYWGSKGVRANMLSPGGVLADQPKEFVKNYSEKVPLGRMARPEEYNGALLFLLSDASSYMTGADLVMDGGWTAW